MQIWQQSDRGTRLCTVPDGRNQHLHSTRILSLSEDLPILVEAVDTEEKIRAVLPELDEMLSDGLIALEKVDVISYRASPPASG